MKKWKIFYAKILEWDKKVLDLLYPLRCPFCDRVTVTNERICTECRKKLSRIKEPVCKKCGKPLDNVQREYCMDCQKSSHVFAQGKALWKYEKQVRESIYRFKYQNRREYAAAYAEELTKAYADWIRRRGIECIVPIPLHKKRRKIRGYNQAELLAKELGRNLGIPVSTNLLVRVKDTQPQKLLNVSERKNNMKKAFKTTENIVQLKYILLVDDIYTTGSTLDAAAFSLLEAGVKKVYACCISIGKG